MAIRDEEPNIWHITFGEKVIKTTLTKDYQVVTKWIEELQNNYDLKLLNIGLDAEWTPKEPPENPIAILQLCVELECLIFQVDCAPRIPGSLITFLDNSEHTFTGVEINRDFQKLAFKRTFLDVNKDTFGSKIVDLRELSLQKGVARNKEGVGMISLAEKVLGMRVEKDKHVRTGTWHSEILDADQVKYASIDAYLSFQIGKEMLKMEDVSETVVDKKNNKKNKRKQNCNILPTKKSRSL